MKKINSLVHWCFLLITFLLLGIFLQSCEKPNINSQKGIEEKSAEYFSLRPDIEKMFGYTHAVKIDNNIKISGAVSMDEKGNPTAIWDMQWQIKNIYSDLEKILFHYGCTFDNVVEENIYTTDMPLFLQNAAYRNTIYTKQFPTGTWVGVKELTIPTFLLEIQLEAYNCA